ncbi:hypothetical protein [Candidatus Scalindua japonica]|uniref:hypothetical protein n=1 Tax=Candidatus Scalindua japonica TaxID=1284222 RepID=UPI000BDF1D44|nr:hypothetical protein [Candidatus Scalindua japonica]
MAYTKSRNKFRLITSSLIIYTISVFLGTAALILFRSSWDTTLGNLIIFMSPYLIYIAVNYGYRHRKRKLNNHLSTDER